MFAGIEINPDKTFTVALMDKNRNIYYIGHYWKEGLFWFLDHTKIKILTININHSDKKYFQQKWKNLLELKDTLISNFEFEVFDGVVHEKTLLFTDTDLFFKEAIRKELLPIYTREGLEQRIYNLPKSGIHIPDNFLSKDRRKLRGEVNAVVSAFTSFSIENKLYSTEEIEGEVFWVPVYKFIPKEKRVITASRF
jgi:hypothetical protein